MFRYHPCNIVKRFSRLVVMAGRKNRKVWKLCLCVRARASTRVWIRLLTNSRLFFSDLSVRLLNKRLDVRNVRRIKLSFPMLYLFSNSWKKTIDVSFKKYINICHSVLINKNIQKLILYYIATFSNSFYTIYTK